MEHYDEVKEILMNYDMFQDDEYLKDTLLGVRCQISKLNNVVFSYNEKGYELGKEAVK